MKPETVQQSVFYVLNVFSSAHNSTQELFKLSSSILKSKYITLFNGLKQKCGVVYWAETSVESVYRKIKFNKELMHTYEWTEGDIIWIFDVLHPNHLCDKFIRRKIRQIFEGKVVFRVISENQFNVYYGTKKLKLNKESVTSIQDLRKRLDSIKVENNV